MRKWKNIGWKKNYQPNLIRKNLPNNIINRTFNFLSRLPLPFLYQKYSISHQAPLFQSPLTRMNLSILISALFLAKLTLSDEVSSCNSSSKIVEYGSIVCDIEYEVCAQDGLIEVGACFGYRCRLELNKKCYYYSYQAYDKRRCLG